MTQLLAGDIGGTKTILRLVEMPTTESGKPVTQLCAQMTSRYEDRFSSAAFPDLVPMVRQFLKAAEAATGKPPAPKNACFAIAGPVVDNSSNLTNLAWALSGDRLQAELNLSTVQLINDFEANGYGVLGLDKDDLHTLQVGELQDKAPIAVIGAGTGLGQGFLIYLEDNYRVFPSEGGHADFAPRSALEFELLKYLLDKHQITRASAERVVSGQGIVAIYQFLRDREFATETPEIAEAIIAWEREAGKSTKTIDPAAVISKGAAETGDRLCQKAMELFTAAYGAEAGNLALKLLPYGGLYIAGGIAAKNLSLMQSGPFMTAFTNKGRVSPLLEKVPVHVVLNSEVGLIGAALRAAQL
ncbi:MAG: glucokinase [Cyanobacteria bacterium P01_A01_bin.123]